MEQTIRAGSLTILTFKDGLLSRLGHDLQLRLPALELTIDQRQVEGRFKTSEIVVEGAARPGGVVDREALSAREQAEIREAMQSKVLLTGKFPDAHLDATLTFKGEHEVLVRGMLELVGQAREIEFAVERRDGHLRGSVVLVPSRWGIAPYKALLGALRLQDRVEIRFELPDPGASGNGAR
ncbi:MAG: YceI family protein [Proteobacteria bacterium]|nr:YceI family protein [Pseudomonadota bacterium]